jgi:hypothetical protein
MFYVLSSDQKLDSRMDFDLGSLKDKPRVKSIPPYCVPPGDEFYSNSQYPTNFTFRNRGGKC